MEKLEERLKELAESKGRPLKILYLEDIDGFYGPQIEALREFGGEYIDVTHSEKVLPYLGVDGVTSDEYKSLGQIDLIIADSTLYDGYGEDLLKALVKESGGKIQIPVAGVSGGGSQDVSAYSAKSLTIGYFKGRAPRTMARLSLRLALGESPEELQKEAKSLDQQIKEYGREAVSKGLKLYIAIPQYVRDHDL